VSFLSAGIHHSLRSDIVDSKIILIVIVAAIVAVAAVAVIALGAGSNDTPPSSDMVRYDGNGGAMDDGITHFDTKMTTVQKCPFKEEGFHFKEWNTKSNGSGTAYHPNDTVALGTVLYAQWSNANELGAVNLYSGVFNLYVGEKGSADVKPIDNGSADLPKSGAILVVAKANSDDTISISENMKITIVSGTKTYDVTLSIPGQGLTLSYGGTLDGDRGVYLEIGQSSTNVSATVSMSVVQHRCPDR